MRETELVGAPAVRPSFFLWLGSLMRRKRYHTRLRVEEPFLAARAFSSRRGPLFSSSALPRRCAFHRSFRCSWRSPLNLPQRLQRRRLLLQLQHRLEQVTILLHPLQHLVRLKHQQRRIALLQAALHLVPLHRSRNRWPLFRPQRVHANRRLVIVVLAPVHEDLADPQRLLHVGDHQLAMLALQQPRDFVRKRFVWS